MEPTIHKSQSILNKPVAAGSPAPALPLADVQGLIFRGYTHPFVRHFILQVRDPTEAKALIGKLVSDDAKPPLLISTAAEWLEKPTTLLNVSMTYAGLNALEIGAFRFDSNFTAFVQGATARAASIGDV